MWTTCGLVSLCRTRSRSCLPFLLPPDGMSSNNKQLFVGFMISWQMGNAPCSGAHLVSDYYISRRLDCWKRICDQKLDRAKSSSGSARGLWSSCGWVDTEIENQRSRQLDGSDIHQHEDKQTAADWEQMDSFFCMLRTKWEGWTKCCTSRVLADGWRRQWQNLN